MRDPEPETCGGLSLSRARHVDGAPRFEFFCWCSVSRNHQGCRDDTFILRDQESVTLAGVKYKLSPFLANNLAAHGELEVPVTQSGVDFADHTMERLMDDTVRFRAEVAMSDEQDHDRSLIPTGPVVPAKSALVRRGIDLAEALARGLKGDQEPKLGSAMPEAENRDDTAAWREFEMLGESIAEGTTVVLTLPELSPSTLPKLLDENVAAVNVRRVLIRPGDPLEGNIPVLDTYSDKGVYIEVFASWCVGWPVQARGSIAGRVKDVKVKPGDKVTVGQSILIAEVTSNDTVVRVIKKAAHAMLLEELPVWWTARERKLPDLSFEAAATEALGPKVPGDD